MRNVHVGWFVEARRDVLQSSAKRNMALCSSLELRGRTKEEGRGANKSVCLCVCAGRGEDKGFPRAASPAPFLPKDVNGTIRAGAFITGERRSSCKSCDRT